MKGAKVLILGWTFKEDVPDIRNTRVIDIHAELQSYGVAVSCFDPEADPVEVKHEYGIEIIQNATAGAPYAAVVLAVRHRSLLSEFTPEKLAALGGGKPPLIIDVKGFMNPGSARANGFSYWQL